MRFNSTSLPRVYLFLVPILCTLFLPTPSLFFICESISGESGISIIGFYRYVRPNDCYWTLHTSMEKGA